MKIEKVISFIRPHILDLVPYASAKSDYTGQADIYLDANESPYGHNNRYPDPLQLRLKESLAKLKNVQKDQLFLGNGSDEIIDLLIRMFCTPQQDKIVVFNPTYGMYQVSADLNDVPTLSIPLDSNFQIDINRFIEVVKQESPKLIFICSPNNPTGNELENVEALIENFNGIVVMDEAYKDFSTKPSLESMVDHFHNLIVISTLSKAWASAGLRIGIAVAHPTIISYLNRIKPPYNISTVNQEHALESLKNADEVRKYVTITNDEKQRVIKELTSIKQVIKIFSSDANFILIQVHNADFLYKSLIDCKIITRNRHPIIDEAIRITIGSPTENNILLHTIKQIYRD